jgi:hypothetical protein
MDKIEIQKQIADLRVQASKLEDVKAHLDVAAYEAAKADIEAKIAAAEQDLAGLTASAQAAQASCDLSQGRQDLTWLVVLLDNTGSMQSIKNDVIGGFNGWLAEQQATPADTCLLTLVKFNESAPWEVVYDLHDIAAITPLSNESYQPRASTPLLDAIGKTLGDLGSKLAGIEPTQRPGRVSVIIITDGEENASKEFAGRKADIFKMIEQMKAGGVVFTFLASNQDAIQEGRGYGVARASSLTMASSGGGTKCMFDILSRETIAHRKGERPDGYVYTAQDRSAQAEQAVDPNDAVVKTQ